MNGGEHKHLQVLKVLSKSDSWVHIQNQDIYITPFLEGDIGGPSVYVLLSLFN